MRVNVDKVLERDQKLSELDDRADALQAGASQFESCAAKLKNKYWWKNCKVSPVDTWNSTDCKSLRHLFIIYFFKKKMTTWLTSCSSFILKSFLPKRKFKVPSCPLMSNAYSLQTLWVEFCLLKAVSLGKGFSSNVKHPVSSLQMMIMMGIIGVIFVGIIFCE